MGINASLFVDAPTTPTNGCTMSREKLLQQGEKNDSYCSNCLKRGVYCRVLDHPSTRPQGTAYVYSFAIVDGEGELQLIGTAIAVAPTLLLTACHNISAEKQRLGVVKRLSSTKVISMRDFIEVVVVDSDVDEDWAILRPVDDTKFLPHATIGMSESDLPLPSVSVTVAHFPVGLSLLEARKKAVEPCQFTTRVAWYEARQPAQRTAKNEERHLKVKNPCREPGQDAVVRHTLPSRDVMVVDGGHVLGSCGAPFFGMDGMVVAFHVQQADDSADVAAPHTRGNVLCKQRRFRAAYVKHIAPELQEGKQQGDQA